MAMTNRSLRLVLMSVLWSAFSGLGARMIMKNRSFAALILATAGLLAGGGDALTRGSAVLAQQSSDTLHDQTKKAGGKLILRVPWDRSVVYPNLEELAKRSDLIVVGRTIGHRPSLRPDGKFITKDFFVKVQSVIRGEIKPGDSILVSLPGGSHRFPDDTYVFVNPIDYKPADDGKTYVFFLRDKGPAYKGHELVGGAQGQFELRDGKVQPADMNRSDPIVTKYKDKAAAAFLAELHRILPTRKK